MAGYIMAGQGVAGLPSYCLGYLNLLALFSVCVTGIVVSVIGVRLCYKTNFPVDFLRKCYSVLAPVLAVGNIFIR